MNPLLNKPDGDGWWVVWMWSWSRKMWYLWGTVQIHEGKNIGGDPLYLQNKMNEGKIRVRKMDVGDPPHDAPENA